VTATSEASRYPVSFDIPVRWRDLDALGHVNNAVYFTYLEMAREAYWNALGYELLPGGFGYLVARAECDFRAPIRQGRVARIRLRCPRLGTKSWEIEYRVEDAADGTVYAEARSVQVYCHLPTGRTEPIPGEVRAAVERLEGRG
jgi:acyl-CoA thioester hydrolase